MIKKIKYIKVFISRDIIFIPFRYDSSSDLYDFYMFKPHSENELCMQGMRTGRLPKEGSKGFINISFDLALYLTTNQIKAPLVYLFKDTFLYELK